MAEEHRCQAPKLCANNCGFFGSPATQNLCSKCYRDLQLTEQQSSSAKLALNQSLVATSSSSSSSSSSSTADFTISSSPPSPPPVFVVKETESKPDESVTVTTAAAAVAVANRCLTCRRRVGLTGFKCKCGMTFCGTHRYPEHHGCTFDFKEMGREQIAKANPVVKAEKLDKI